MMLTHCGNNVRNRYSGCVFSVKDIVPVPLKTSRNLPDCPLCGSLMVLRTARSGKSAGKQFWGCSTYPDCRGVVNM